MLLRNLHVNEVNAEQGSELVIGEKGVPGTVLNCNLCQVYDHAEFSVVASQIDATGNLPSATSSTASFDAVGAGRMRFIDMDLAELDLTAREHGVLSLLNAPHDPARLNHLDQATSTVQIAPRAAYFTASRLSGSAPLAVHFVDLAAGYPSSYLWEFGDGQNSTEASPTHSYTTEGNFDVRLTVGYPDGKVETFQRNGYIRINAVVFVDGFESPP